MEVLNKRPELSNTMMEHTKMCCKLLERMMKQGYSDEDDTEEDDTDHSRDLLTLPENGGNGTNGRRD